MQRETGLVGQIEQMEKQMQKYVQVQGDQLNMVVFFWHLVKGDLYSIRYRTQVAYTGTQVLEKHRHV